MKTKRILSLLLTLVMICGLLTMNIQTAEAATPSSGTLLALSNYSGYPDQVNHTFKIRIKTTNDCDASEGNCEASRVHIYGLDNGDIYLNKSLMHNEGNVLEKTYTSYIYPNAAQLVLAEDIFDSRDYACDVTLFCDGEEIDTVNLYAKGGGGFSDSTELYFTESHTSFPSISDGLIVPSTTNITASRNSTVNNSISFYAKTKDGADAYDPGAAYSAKILNVKSGSVTAYGLDGLVPASSVKLVNTGNQAVTFPGISVNTSYKRVEVGPGFISGYNGTSATFKVSAQVGMHADSYFWGGLKTIYSSQITVTKPTYKVNFDKNGGEGGSMAPQTLYYGNDSNKANLPANVFTKTGYTFDGWSLNANGSGTRYADKASVLNLTTGSSVTLYAQWKLNEYSVSYEKNKPATTSNQVTGTMANSSHTYSVAKNISANQYSLTGYTFNGWNTIANGGGTAYANSASIINLTTVNGATVPFYAQWLPHTYTVAYNQNKPTNASTTVTGTTENSSHIYDVAKNITPNEYALTGYTFKGWNTASNGSGTSYANNASVKNLTATDGATVTLYAKWDANEYDITFHEEGGSTVSDQTVVFDSTTNNEVAVPSREGYTFNGWFTQQSGGIMVYNADGTCAKNTAYWDVNGKWINSDDVILYAQWTANTYTLTYDTKGGSPLEDQTVTFDSPYIGESPERVGYIFDRWFKDTAYTQPITIGSTLVKTAADHSIYAKWNPITYKIYYADGTNTVKVENAKYGEAFNLPLASTLNLTPPVNHHFVGWNNLSADTTTVTYADGQRITTGLTTINNDSVNLFAVWAPNDTYRVVYDPNGGSGSPKDNNSYYEGNTVSINFATPTRPGYQFSGWSKEADTAVPIYTQTGTTSFEMGDENVTLYAVWKPIGYTVKYHTGTAETISDTECTYDVEAVLNDGSTLTKDDYTFKGWAISQDSNVVTYAPGAKVLNLSNINGAEIDLYAVWQEDGKFRLSYNANGGYGAPEYQENYAGKVLTVSNIVPVRENYTFLGWDEDAEATSATYQASDSFTLGSSNTVLYAVWKKNPSLTYHANGGLFEETIATIYPASGSDVAFTTVEPIRDGYTFLGWNTDKNANVALASLIMPDGNTVLYAVWEISQYTVELPSSAAGYSVFYNGTKVTAPTSVLTDNGEKVSFEVVIKEGYSPKNMNVVFGNVALGYISLSGDTYTYETPAITSDGIVEVRGIEEITFPITLNNGTGFTVSPANQIVSYNKTLQFKVTLDDTYALTAPSVYVDGNSITGVKNGNEYTYTINNITSQPVISISATKNPQHTAIFVSGGSVYTFSTVEDKSALVSPLAPEKAGYTFGGWYTEKECTNPYDFTALVTEDIVLYAKWIADTYAVSYDLNSAPGTAPASQTKTHDITLKLSEALPEREGYTFKGWNTEASGLGTPYGAGSEYIANAPATLYAQWEKNVYTVKYMVDGAVYRSETVEYGKKATKPTNPVKQGETFKEWMNGDVVWNFDSEIAEDITLTATWTTDGFVVVLPEDGMGYDVSTSGNVSVNYGDNVTFTITILEHYNADSMKVYANGALIIPSISGNEYTYIVENVKVDTTITVTDVKPDIYTVAYIADGETVHTEQVVYQGLATTPRTPVKSGHAFDYWTYNGAQWDFNTEIDADINLIAQFTPLTYQITLPQNTIGYTVTQTSSENPVTYNNEFAFDVIVDAAHNADDITVYANGMLLEAVAENGSTISFSIPEVKEATVITVKGIGTNTYAVTYRANTTEYVGNMPDAFIKTHDEDCTVSALVPERHGYSFLGWSVETDGNVDYDPTENYSDNSDLVLYAVWEAKQFTVEFVTNGGTINSGEISGYTYGTGVALPNDVSFAGFDFAGWYEDELMQGVKVTEITSSDYGNKKYYAAYTIADVTVNGYTGEYDGAYHSINFSLTDALKLPVEKYQWYFIPEGTTTAIAVDSDSYNEYKVKDVAQNGQYYCYVETVFADSDISVHFLTNQATVTITKKPVTIKAEDASKVYDATALATDAIVLVDGTALVAGHTMRGVMTDASTITNVGTQENVIDTIVISDAENKDATANYEIITQSGALTITPATLVVVANNVTKSANSMLEEKGLYKISGQYSSETLSLENVTLIAKNENNVEVALGDITKNAGTYQVTITYDGFSGDGNENYMGTGTITSVVTVYRRSGGGGGGLVTPTYTIQYESNGGSDVESVKVTSGKVVQVPETPVKDGYMFDGWYTDKELTTAYDFAAKVTKGFTLYAKWTEIEKEPEVVDPDTTISFKDVKADDWFYANVQYVVENKLMNGVAEDKFAPNDTLTRAMLVTVLYRNEGEPATNRSIPFADVDMDAYYANAVSWAKQNGIVNGVTENVFAPDANITREQIAAIMFRYAQYKGFDTVTSEENLHFTDDNEISEYAVSSMNWAVGTGLMQGKSTTTINPLDNATRAEIAAILQRFIEANK